MNNSIAKIANQILTAQPPDTGQIDTLLKQSKKDFDDLIYWANKIREKFFGNKIAVCSIVPGRIGGCNQDCKFCAQAAQHNTEFTKAKTLTDEQILKAAKQAKKNKVPNFGIVYSGKTITEKQLARLEKLIKQIRSDLDMGVCASLGIINTNQAKRLAKAGLSRYNHNLETSENHFPNIVTTHKYSDRINTIKAAQQAGLGICAGGIFGIGETDSDRIQMAIQLRTLGVDTVPMNFLHPIEGTPLEKNKTLSPKKILRIIALYRFILPKTNLKIAGGRVLNLRDLQSWIFRAGATSILTGNYLTTAGRDAKKDIQMLSDLGLQIN